MGVTLKCSVKVGRDISFDEIRNSFDAVLLAVGGWKSRKLGMKDEDADGVISGTDFLWLIAHKDLQKINGTVIVIGGGSTAVDVARSALRLGADKIILAYRRTIDQMPAEEEEIEELIEEGIYPTELTDIRRIITENNKIKGIETVKQELKGFDSSGRKNPVPVSNEEALEILYCDLLIPAISQNVDISFAENIETNRNGTVKIDTDTYRTSTDKVFASGDAVGISNIAAAIGQGEKAAVEIEKFLNPGIIKKFKWRVPESPHVEFDPNIEPVEQERVKTEYSSVEDRIKNFLLVNRGVNWESKIHDETLRCLRCDYIVNFEEEEDE